MKITVKKIVIIALINVALQPSCKQSKTMKPPVAKKIPKELVTNGKKRIDNYYWLNQRENPKVIEYLNAENKYTEAILKPTEKLQEQLFVEMKKRIKEDDKSVPVLNNGYYYYSRYEKGKEYPIYCRKKGSLDAHEEIFLDVNLLAQGQKYCKVNDYEVSPNNKILAYGIDLVSRRQYKIHFKNLETGKNYPDSIENTTGSVVWASDNKTVFYTRKDPETLRSFQIYKHTLGQDPKNDQLVFQEDNETFDVDVFDTKDRKYIVIASYSTLSDEYRYIPADQPNGEFKIFQPRRRGLEYSIDHIHDKFYIRTNLNAENFHIYTTGEQNTLKENWKPLWKYNDSIFTEEFELLSDFIVVKQKKAGIGNLYVKNIKTGKDYDISFNEEVFDVWISANHEPESVVLRFGYTSLTTPTEIYDYNLITKERKLLKQTEILGGFDKNNYEAKRLWATASDGTKIPISIVYRKGIELNSGNNPTVLYGYGSYGYSLDPYFSSTRLSLLDRGFIYAIAHIRGGQEMGRQWYENGKLLKKKNTFTDFIACAQYLINQRYTSSDKLFAWGGSAGGLLVGAVANMAPQLFKGIIAEVPFVDVVTTMLDESIPLTTGEFDEWGNPKDSVYYNYMLSYSPYDNVTAQDYPNMLVTTGLHDSQVQYWEPAKWVAKLRATKTDNNLLLLYTNMDTGHGGASGRFEALKEYAMDYAFIFYLLGIEK